MPAKWHRNQSRRKRTFWPKKSELCNLSAVRELRITALFSCGAEGCGGAGHEDSKPSSLHTGKCGSDFNLPWTTRYSYACNDVPARHGSWLGASETVFCRTDCVWRDRRLRREALARYATVPQEEEGIASHIKQANKSPSQVFWFSLASTFAMTQTP